MEDQLSLLPDLEPLTFNEAAATLTAMEAAVYNSALDAAVASVHAVVLNGPPDLAAMARALLDAVAAEIGGLKL